MARDRITPGDELEVTVGDIDLSGTVEAVSLKDMAVDELPTITVELDSGFVFTAPYAEPFDPRTDDHEAR